MKKLLLMIMMLFVAQSAVAAKPEELMNKDGSIGTFQYEEERDLNRGTEQPVKQVKRVKKHRSKRSLERDLKQISPD